MTSFLDRDLSDRIAREGTHIIDGGTYNMRVDGKGYTIFYLSEQGYLYLFATRHGDTCSTFFV